ncbi:DUF2262 domain-containing protein [Pedobacter caeni]|uniref:DUF2262 domain-containing protein n=1 Tax=Pedobacter caeni TaxID=288992 RepID=A0A1M5JUZ0_9SPHI|nr:DUF2262 domain-containing protein [Pedobacter caeni]SHG44110.1 hypothetical protein SAMN04488522_105513 [Pedobacter caeni]
MIGWEFDDLMSVLQEARLGNPKRLNILLKANPLAVVSEDYSLLLLMRHFQVQYWNEERRVLNARPEDKFTQWGITIISSEESGGSQMNAYVPNNLTYTGLELRGKEVSIFTETETILTNVIELRRKMHFYGAFKEADLEETFKALNNEQYPTKTVSKPKAKDKTIENEVLGTLIYNEETGQYESEYAGEDGSFQVGIALTTPKKLEQLISFAAQQIREKTYKEMLLSMEAEMIELKNDVWIGEDENGQEEAPISVEEFRKRISISSIDFYEDGSASIYCKDDDVFFGHTIIVDVDEKGKYDSVTLAG